MQHIKKMWMGIALVAFVPAVTFAANITDLKSLINELKGMANSLIVLFLALAVVAFIWGVTKYLYSSDPKKISEARDYLIWGIIAITVIFSIWGIAAMLKNTFFSNTDSSYSPGSGVPRASDSFQYEPSRSRSTGDTYQYGR